MGITQKVLLIVSVFSLLLSVSACSEKQKEIKDEISNTTVVISTNMAAEYQKQQTENEKENNYISNSTSATTPVFTAGAPDVVTSQHSTETEYTESTKITTQVAVPNQDTDRKPFEIPTLAERTAWNLKLTVKEAHAGDKKIQANITDYDNQGFTLDLSDFGLERYNGSEWADITDSSVLSDEVSVLAQTDRNASVDFRIFVSQISKEPLEEGKYKLKGSVSGYPVSAEFEVLP